MENYDLIVARHSVRQYLPKPIEADKRALIEEEIKNLKEMLAVLEDLIAKMDAA